MALPRISIIVGNGDHDSQGSLGVISLGFGIHLAWTFLLMYGLPFLFPALDLVVQGPGQLGRLGPVPFVAIVVFAGTLFVAAATDQRLLPTYTSKRGIIASSIAAMLGGVVLYACSLVAQPHISFALIAGALIGFGTAILLIFWSIAYSRCDSPTIVVNTGAGIVIALAIYLVFLRVVSTDTGRILLPLLPLLELPLLWKLTPVSYAIRHAVPIFNPLPVKKLPFSFWLGAPVFMLGFVLGVLRHVSLQVVVPQADTATLLGILLTASIIAMALTVVTSMGKRSHWDLLLRVVVPFVALATLLIPSLFKESSLVASLALVVGFVSLEALLWSFLAELCQEFRPSPVFVFSLSNACLAIGALVGQYIVLSPSLDNIASLNDVTGILPVIVIMIVAVSLLPHVRDIKRITSRAHKEAPVIDVLEDDHAAEESSREEERLVAAELTAQATRSYAKEAASDVARTDGPAGEAASGDTLAASGGSAGTVSGGEKPWGRRAGRFRLQCEAVADRYLLSRRETEVMYLLAKGHNAAYIQDSLYISRSTAKTHINHVYRKLDIHSQQELINMVESCEDYRRD